MITFPGRKWILLTRRLTTDREGCFHKVRCFVIPSQLARINACFYLDLEISSFSMSGLDHYYLT